MDVKEGVARRGDVGLWWERFGPPGERSIVFHPGSGDTADVAPIAFFERLHAAGWSVLRFDPRDTGRSTRTSDDSVYGLDDLAADLWAVADDAEIGSATLIGYSLGGAIIQAAAVAGPERVDALVVLATPARPPDTVLGDTPMAVMATFAYDETPMVFDEDTKVFHGATPEAIAEVQRRMADGRGPTGRSSTRHGAAAMSGPIPTDEQLNELTCPVLVLHSTDDVWVPHQQADASARPYPSAVVQRTCGIGHVPLDHQWLDLADEMTTFLTSAARGRGAAIALRDATPEDAELLARVMLIATRSHLERGAWDYLLGWDEPATLEFLAQLAVSEPEHLFTYSRFVIATVDGEPAAAASGHRPEVHGFPVYLPVFDDLLRKTGVTDLEYAEIWARGDVLTSASAGPPPPGTWVIESVATGPAFRGMGLVDRLLTELLERGVAVGCDRARIETLLIGNEAARRAYVKHGFQSVAKTGGYGWQDIFGSAGFEVLERSL